MGIDLQQLHFVVFGREVFKTELLQAFVEQEAIFHPSRTKVDFIRGFWNADILLNELILHHPVGSVAPRVGLRIQFIAHRILFHQSLVEPAGRVDSHEGRLLAAHKGYHAGDIFFAEGDQIQVKINGVDVFHPNTGEVRSDGAEGIACWFIDTNYNGESFFVRHAYFTGAGEPYKRLQRALRAEIDESAWAELYSTVSRPFDKPETGKIAIKVINHYGDEVLKVFTID